LSWISKSRKFPRILPEIYFFIRNFVVGGLLLFPATDVMSTPQLGHVPQCLGEIAHVSLRDMENVAIRVKTDEVKQVFI
jgi:hypothetical protein